MTYNLHEAIAEAANRAIDPDHEKYPHLFKIRPISNEEIGRHQAAYSSKVKSTEHPHQYLGQLAKSIPKAIQLEEVRYVPVSGVLQGVPKSKLRAGGWAKVRGADSVTVTVVEPDMWIDLGTGEILTKKVAREGGRKISTAKSISDRMLETIERIAQCAPSERDFVSYILKMRNRRGGLVVDLNTAIDLWITHKHPRIDKANKARKRKRLAAILEKRRIMVNTQTLASDLQVLGNPTKQEIIEESARVFEILKPKAKPGCGALQLMPRQ